MAEIKYIPVSKLWGHPDNPRKDLGDVTELAESIKVNGVLQNLTVVPLIGEITKKWDGESYRVIIGHRRRPQSWPVWKSSPASWSRCRSGSS